MTCKFIIYQWKVSGTAGEKARMAECHNISWHWSPIEQAEFSQGCWSASWSHSRKCGFELFTLFIFHLKEAHYTLILYNWERHAFVQTVSPLESYRGTEQSLKTTKEWRLSCAHRHLPVSSDCMALLMSYWAPVNIHTKHLISLSRNYIFMFWQSSHRGFIKL